MRILSLTALCLLSFSVLAETHDPIRHVTLTPIEVAPAESWEVTGAVSRRYQIPLSFRVGGQVNERAVEVGQTVAKDQVLARLDQADLKLTIAQREASLGSAKADQLNAKRERVRLTKLYKNKLVSEQDLQRAETAEVSSQQAVLAAEAALELAQRQLGYSTLKSPGDGVLTSVDVEEGQVVNAGQTLMQLATGPFEAVVYLPSNRLQASLQQATAIGVDHAGQCRAVLRAKTPVNNAASLQYKAYYTLSDCNHSLPLGAVVRLQFQQQNDDLKRIPISALVNHGNQSAVWQVVKDQVHAVAVEVDHLDNDYAYIRTALPTGTGIVARGTHLLVENQVVATQP